MLIKDSALIPDWLKENLEEHCPYCGSPYHVGYSPNGMRVTKHYCPNKACPATVAMKMAYMWTTLKVDGIKYGRSMELVKRFHITRHLDAIPRVFKEKPRLDLATFMRINCIPGIDSAWDKMCENKNSVEEVLEIPTVSNLLTDEDKQYIIEASNYFEIVYPTKQEFEPVVRMTVMITGDVLGLDNRELLIAALNHKYKGLLDLRYSKSKRKTGITALIKEENSAITGKVQIAKECGIPIMTPRQFLVYVDNLVREKAGDKYDF